MKMPAIGRLAHIVLLRKSSKDGTPMTNGGDRPDTEKQILWPACHRRSRSCGLRVTGEAEPNVAACHREADPVACGARENTIEKPAQEGREAHKSGEPQKTSLARSPVTIENDIQRDKAAQRSLMSGFSSTHRR